MLMIDEALYGGSPRTYLSRCRIAVFPPSRVSLTRIAEAAFIELRCRYVLRQGLVHQSKSFPEDMCCIF
jgi:hypothetical protein